MQYQGMQEDLNKKWAGQTLNNQAAWDEFQNDFWAYSIAEAKSYCRNEQQCQDLVRRMMNNLSREFASKPLPRDLCFEIIVRLGLLYGKTGGNTAAGDANSAGYHTSDLKEPQYTAGTTDPYAAGSFASGNREQRPGEPTRQTVQDGWENQYPAGGAVYGERMDGVRSSDSDRYGSYRGVYGQDMPRQEQPWSPSAQAPSFDAGRNAAPGAYAPGYTDQNPQHFGDASYPAGVRPLNDRPGAVSGHPAGTGLESAPVQPAQEAPQVQMDKEQGKTEQGQSAVQMPAAQAGAIPVQTQYIPYIQQVPGAVPMGQTVIASPMPVGMPIGQVPIQTISVQPVMQIPVQPVMQTPIQTAVVQPQIIQQKVKPTVVAEPASTEKAQELLGMNGTGNASDDQAVIERAAQLIQAYNAANKVEDAFETAEAEEEVDTQTPAEADPSKAAGWRPPRFGVRKTAKPKEKPPVKPVVPKQNQNKAEPAKAQPAGQNAKSDTEKEEGSSTFSIINTVLIVLTIASVGFLIWETGLIQRFL